MNKIAFKLLLSTCAGCQEGCSRDSTMQKLKRSRFFSVAADLALRLGPDSERSGTKVCKKYETLWLHQRGKSWKTNTTTRQQRRHANLPGQICVSLAEKTAKQHKTGPEPHQTKNLQIHGIASDTIGLSSLTLSNMHKQIVCGPNKLIGVRSYATVKISTRLLQRKPPQSPLRRALSNRLPAESRQRKSWQGQTAAL